MAYQPKLRDDLRLERTEGDPTPALYDPVHDRRVNLGAFSYAIAQRLDGTRTLAAIADEIALSFGPAGAVRDEIERTLRSFFLLHLIDGAGGPTLERKRALRSGASKLSWSILGEARFACQGSGECCQNYAFGPLTDADVARIAALDADIARVYPDIGPGPHFHEISTSDGGKGRYLNKVDERCVFLRSDNRCGLHAAFGADSKPGLCSLYPYVPLATIDGIKVYDNGECASFATSARTGTPLAEDLPRLEKLSGELALYHPVVFLDARTPCDYGYFLAAQSVLADLVALGKSDACGTLVAAGRVLRGFVRALGTCPFEPGEPERAAAAALEVDLAEVFERPAPADVVGAGLVAIADVTSDLMRTVARVIAVAQPSPRDILTARLAREIAQVLHVVHTLAAYRADPAAVELPPYYAEIAAVPAGGAEVEEALRISLRQKIFGHRALIEERPVPAMLRLAIAHLVAIFGGKLRAAADRAPGVRPQDLSFGHMLANRVLRQSSVARVFVEHEDRAWVAVEAVPALART